MRLEAIQRASDLLYDQTDRMKLFRSQKLYADVIHTRVSQISEKQKQKELEKVEALKYHEDILRQVKVGDETEKAKIAEQLAQIEIVKASRVQQREQARLIREEVARKNREEGMKLKKDAQERLEEELIEYQLKQNLAAENNARMIKANEDLKVVRQKMKEDEKRAEEERDSQVGAIEYRHMMLKQLEKKRFDKAQETRQKIIDAAIEQLKKKTSHEEAILEKQIQDIKDREERELAAKEAMLRKQKADIDEGRRLQMARLEEERRRDYEEEQQMIERWRRENEDAIRHEREKEQKARLETIRIKKIQLDDAKERARRREEERLIELEQQRFLATLDNGDEAKFIALCKAEIEKNIKEGKPVYTLLKALEYAEPPLLPAKITNKRS